MKISTIVTILAFLVFSAILFISTPFFNIVVEMWGEIEKIGALATALALFFAINQGMHIQKSAKENEISNNNNLFQQKFNLILEQHNNTLKSVNSWFNKAMLNPYELKTDELIIKLRGNENLSPYMRILYHTLKSVREEFPSSTGKSNPHDFSSQKRYTSLVRSFIPNDILFLISINASVYDKRHFIFPDSEQYKYYHTMLMDYDFFEHLVINAQTSLNLKKTIQSISELTYSACLASYVKSTNSSLFNRHDFIHIEKFNDLMLDSKFYTCLSYNIQNKYILTPSYLHKKITLSKLIKIYMHEHQKTLSTSGLNGYIEKEINETIKNRVKEIVNQHNVFWLPPHFNSASDALFDSRKVVDFLTKNIKLANSSESNIIFRDNFHSDLRLSIENASYHDKQCAGYDINLNKNMESIPRQIELILNELIKLKQHIKYIETPEEILNKKRSLLTSKINDLMKK